MFLKIFLIFCLNFNSVFRYCQFGFPIPRFRHPGGSNLILSRPGNESGQPDQKIYAKLWVWEPGSVQVDKKGDQGPEKLKGKETVPDSPEKGRNGF